MIFGVNFVIKFMSIILINKLKQFDSLILLLLFIKTTFYITLKNIKLRSKK